MGVGRPVFADFCPTLEKMSVGIFPAMDIEWKPITQLRSPIKLDPQLPRRIPNRIRNFIRFKISRILSPTFRQVRWVG